MHRKNVFLIGWWKQTLMKNAQASIWICYLPRAAELVELATGGENDESDLSITKNRKFISFLEQTISSLWESHLTVDLVFYPLQLHSTSSHFFFLANFLKLLWYFCQVCGVCATVSLLYIYTGKNIYRVLWRGWCNNHVLSGDGWGSRGEVNKERVLKIP